MRKLLIGLALLVTTLTACDLGRPVTTSIALPTPAGIRVQCFYEEEVIFDQPFDRAETQPDGTVRVWIGAEYVDMDGDCKVVTPTP